MITNVCGDYMIKPYPIQKYVYLTESSHAGGGPFVFYNPNTRRNNYFNNAELIKGVLQSNNQINISDFGCPNFRDVTYLITINTQIDLGVCGSYSSLFLGDVDTISALPFVFPVDIFTELKINANFIFSADQKINASVLKDTLIMTSIEFIGEQFNVKQWWYLIPPHIKANTPNSELLNLNPIYLEAVDINENGIVDVPEECADENNLITCNAYNDSLKSYHAKFINEENIEFPLNIQNVVTGNTGFHHFDFEPLNDDGEVDYVNSYLLNETYSILDTTIIYIQNGPVQVKGEYSGTVFVLTDDNTTYRRHASKFSMGGPDIVPIDTVWNNIWITDNIINEDSENGDMSNIQPDENCEGGSPNNLYLISGANIIVANTELNRKNVNINA